MGGFEPLTAEDVAEQIIWVVATARREKGVAVKAVDVVPSVQRMLYVIDKSWNERNGVEDMQMSQKYFCRQGERMCSQVIYCLRHERIR